MKKFKLLMLVAGMLTCSDMGYTEVLSVQEELAGIASGRYRYVTQQPNVSSDAFYVEWCGLSRVVRKHSSLKERINQIEYVINSKNIDPDILCRAVVELHNIYSYEYKSEEDQDFALKLLKKLAYTSRRAQLEIILNALTPYELFTKSGNMLLHEAVKYDEFFPYDNGALPVVKKEYLVLMLGISNMVLGIKEPLNISEEYKGYYGIPVSLIYGLLSKNKYEAMDRLKKIPEDSIPAKLHKLLNDSIKPAYLPVRNPERLLLTGLAAEYLFPDAATECYIRSLTKGNGLRHHEHGLGILSEHYLGINAPKEAAHLRKVLSHLKPDSEWLK